MKNLVRNLQNKDEFVLAEKVRKALAESDTDFIKSPYPGDKDSYAWNKHRSILMNQKGDYVKIKVASDKKKLKKLIDLMIKDKFVDYDDGKKTKYKKDSRSTRVS